jgi:hypothetical protein
MASKKGSKPKAKPKAKSKGLGYDPISGQLRAKTNKNDDDVTLNHYTGKKTDNISHKDKKPPKGTHPMPISRMKRKIEK